MQSFGTPRATTNPYIHMLDAALATTEGLDHRRFDRRAALVGRLDALHFHWPETLFGGSTPAKALARRLFATALVLRLQLTRVAVVRTVHNVELPRDVNRWERMLLRRIDARTDHRIVLNAETAGAGSPTSSMIPHGHFRDWFSSAPHPDAEPRTIGFIGLVRRYKGVEALLAAFAQTDMTHTEWRLRVCGNPTSESLAREVRASAEADSRIGLDLRFLAEPEFARAIRSVAGVVLPYRFMHNSGAVLAALSLDRPVLVPDNDVNRSLRDEVGAEWVFLYGDELTADDLRGFMDSLGHGGPPGSPDLSSRGWAEAGEQHRAAYVRAIATRRARRRRRGSR
ncbi:glycosyl transferase [Microbacterium sp. LRZ72]|nr:glycosyl transferase [Microbacterium sp. LRZ72]